MTLRGRLSMIASTDLPAGRTDDLLKLTSDIVAAYVSNNPVPVSELPGMIKSVHSTLGNLPGTPQEYRAKWGLPADYPMVAPNYAAQRSEFAKKIGLGRNAPAHKGRRRG